MKKSIWDKKSILSYINSRYVSKRVKAIIPIEPPLTYDENGIQRFIDIVLKPNFVKLSWEDFTRYLMWIKHYIQQYDNSPHSKVIDRFIEVLLNSQDLYDRMIFTTDSSYMMTDVNIFYDMAFISIPDGEIEYQMEGLIIPEKLKEYISYIADTYEYLPIHIYLCNSPFSDIKDERQFFEMIKDDIEQRIAMEVDFDEYF